ncbi:hypothetical protein AV530_014555 [Patagioenas fasciata monilis]|uniref:Uncharacterized protein n=1 Tax=Patagioenas fasciata monilis TaxID=372326 RepID=A0A1V4KC60_PATFA|nr:hypothetical protein AV530_014555 [Patagioenas fasciata monilis]
MSLDGYIKSGLILAAERQGFTWRFTELNKNAHPLRISTPKLYAVSELLFTLLSDVFRQEIMSTSASCSFKL